MKFSFCSIAFRDQKITNQEIVTLLAKAGYHGIELWANHVNNGVDLKVLKGYLQETNLSVPMLSPYFDFTAGPKRWRQSLETATRFVRIATFLEAPLIRAFTGIVGSADATEAQKRDCIRGLQKVCRIAEKSNVIVALETHPSTLVDTVESTLWLIEKVGAPNLKINLDIYHMFEVHKDSIMVLEALLPYVAHVHAKNAFFEPEQREQAKHPLLHDPQPKADFVGVMPLASGEMDYEPFIGALVQNKYDGYVSVEWFGSNSTEAAIRELAYLKNLAAKNGQAQAAASIGGSAK